MTSDLAVLVEASGGLAMAITALFFGLTSKGVRKVNGLQPALFAIAFYGASNVFYAAAYFGSETGSFRLWDTTAELLVRSGQILSVWTIPILLLFATRSIVKGDG